MSADIVITKLMRQVEHLRDENGRLLIALRGYEAEPVSPFPALSGEDVVAILHPHHHRGQPCRRR